MRSFFYTFVLAVAAVVACGLSGWQLREGNFNALLGSPPVTFGERIYKNFNPADVKRIRVSQNGIDASFELGDKGWQASAPWEDRMDPRAAVAIINFTLGMRVEDLGEVREVDPASAGLGANVFDIRLDGNDHKRLARFKLGRRTPWLATVEEIDKPVPTVFVQPRDKGHQGYVYACTGDITPLFKDGMKFLRDHHPLFFNPATLQTIRIRAEEGELTLSRDSVKSAWRVAKPMALPTSPKAMKALITGLRELQAVRISERTASPLPVIPALAKSWQIALANFGSDNETILEISPPDSAEDSLAHAVVSDRPGCTFDLPLKPAASAVSLADLPLAINDLRDPSIMALDIPALRQVSIQPAKGPEILITRVPPKPWMTMIDGVSQEANEERLFTLLKAVTEGTAIDFKTDAATDFTPWGLNKPFLKLHFSGANEQDLLFGTDGKGGYFTSRSGGATVMQVDPSLIASIPSRAYEWRHPRVWSVDRTNLLSIQRQSAGEINPLVLDYDFNKDEWKAKRVNVDQQNVPPKITSTDLTASLDSSRANYLLGILEGLKATRWLAPDEPSAMAALATPSLTFYVTENEVDETGEVENGKKTTRGILFAPASVAANPGFYYGCLASESHPFLVDPETYGKLATEVLEKN